MRPEAVAGHDLVVGGTGMLRVVVERLLARGGRVSVLARGRRGLGGLASSAPARPGALECVAVDYTDDAAFAAALAGAIERHGTPGRAVAWIHDDTAPATLGLLARVLADGGGATTLWEIVGSVDQALSVVASQSRVQIAVSSLDHRQILLGYAPGPPGAGSQTARSPRGS